MEKEAFQMGTSMNSQIRTWGLCVLGGIRPEMRWEAEGVLALGMGRGQLSLIPLSPRGIALVMKHIQVDSPY